MFFKKYTFSGTIKENLRWGNESASDEEIIHACKLAQADEFVTGLPEGYDTYIEQVVPMYLVDRSRDCVLHVHC